MKKTIKVISALMFSTITSSSIIACANPFVDPNIFRITIVTDGHTITDQSFNQSSYEGALQFKSEFERWNSDPSSSADEWRNKKVVVTPIQPSTIELNNLLQSYGQAVVMDSKVTIASGFVQNSALVKAQNEKLKGKMRYIYVDGDTPNEIVPPENKNLAGLLYKAEQSALMAALAAGVWLIANNAQYGGPNNLKMSTYGGINIPAVTHFMYGFYWGLWLLNNSTNYPKLNEEVKTAIKILNPDFDTSQPLPNIEFIDLPDQYSGSFDQASASSKAINSSLVDKGANVIFPVAGPQTSDTLAAIKDKGSNGKVIGVDTDQQLQYKESANYFLTSALKEIASSINFMLWRSINRSDEEEHEILPEGEEYNTFQEDAIYRDGSDFVGIADNEAISPIFHNITESEALNGENGFLAKLSDGWQEVLVTSRGDYWVDGKKVNPFNS